MVDFFLTLSWKSAETSSLDVTELVQGQIMCLIGSDNQPTFLPSVCSDSIKFKALCRTIALGRICCVVSP